MKALLVLLPLAIAARAQEAAPARTEPQAAAPAADAARALWTSFLAASGSRADSPPITSFHVSADVILHEGLRNNQLRTEYRFLAPDRIRFLLSSRRETARYGPKQREYWLRDGDEFVELTGAEHEEDRRQVDRMLAVARNFVGLSDPAKIRIERCELLPGAPSDLGPGREREAKKLRWLRVASPDFVLTPEAADRAPAEGTLVEVELGLLDTNVPEFVVVRPSAPKGAPAAGGPMLLELGQPVEHDGYRVPQWIKVHELDRATSPPVFATTPAQDIYIESIDLRPALTPQDFEPRPR